MPNDEKTRAEILVRGRHTPSARNSIKKRETYKLLLHFIHDKLVSMAYENNSIFWVEVEKIVPNPYQPRREFNEQSLKELADSIRMYGILQPLTVTRSEVHLDDGSFHTQYELVAGERRLRAAKLAGLEQVPVIIRSGEETELMKLEIAIIENLQREDLNPIDRALAFKQLVEQFKLSHGQIAKKVGRSRVYVSNTVRLLNLPDTILSALSNGEISDGHARALLALAGKPEEQDTVFRETLYKKLSVREVEHLARGLATENTKKKKWKTTDSELLDIEKQFAESLGTRVQISKTDYGGKITIDYFTPEDLKKILTLVGQKEETVSAPTPVSVAQSQTGESKSPESQVEEEETKVFEDHSPDTPGEEPKEEGEEDLYSIKNFSV